MYTLTVDPIYTYISNPSEQLEKILDNALSYQPEGVMYLRDVEWDGKVHLYKDTKHYFPTGCLIRVCSILKDLKYEYKVEYKIPQLEQNANFKFYGQLRDYQEEDLNKLNIRKTKRGVIWAVTGYGKTALAMAILAQINIKPAIIIVDTEELMYQTAEAVKHFLHVEPGLFGDSIKDMSKDITVAIIDSLWSSVGKKNDEKEKFDWGVLKFINDMPVVIVDECQSIPAKSFCNTLKKMKNAVFRAGLSGTPWRDDGHTLAIEGCLSAILIKRPAQDLISKGYLANPTILMAPVKQLNDTKWNDWHRVKDDYKSIYTDFIVNNDYRNKLIVDSIKSKTNMPVLILVERIDHGHKLMKTLEESTLELKVKYVHGKSDDRSEVFQEFREGKIDVLISSRIGNVGVDLPNVRCLVIAGAGKGSVLTYQRVGRALRACPGKTQVLIIDFKDYTKYLRSHADRRAELYEAVGFYTKVLKDANELEKNIHTYDAAKNIQPTVPQTPDSAKP